MSRRSILLRNNSMECLVDKLILAWSAVGLYVAVTLVLAWRGWRRTSSVASFATGGGSLPPWMVGLALAAQLTSVATFVVNPGLVFAYGLAGLLGFGVAAALGITAGLLLFSSAFRRVGARGAALTVPQWIGARFDSPGLAVSFGVLSLGLISYAVLIVVALAYVLGLLLGLPPWLPALALIVFVFGYVSLGGANAHASTNAVQAVIMLVVALLLIGTGLPTLWQGDGLFAALQAMDPVLVQATNPTSLYFRNLFEVFGCNFLVGLALVCQPHILSKALYVKSDRDVRRYLAVAIVVGTVFMMMMWVGLFARLELPAATSIDTVVPLYIASHFGPGLQVLISVGLLCAGISTLEGLVLAISAIVSVDLFLVPLGARLMPGKSQAERGRVALAVGRGAIALAAVLTALLSLQQLDNPTGGSVAIFAQYGIYGLITASFVPLGAGMFIPSAGRASVTAGAVASIGAYVGAAGLGFTAMSNNPAFLATCGIIAGWGAFALVQLVTVLRNRTVTSTGALHDVPATR
jgi:sodium/pantothenate symporter